MSKSGTTISYTYNADGLRSTKTVGSTVYQYYYDPSGQLTDVLWGSNKLHFVYDSLGPVAVTYNGTRYYYLRNAQGDITGIMTRNKEQVVSYTYDAWGNVLSVTGTKADTLGAANPLRYRGYLYDSETGLYYLQSRYYNPAWGRFINADTTSVLSASPDSATWDKNLFAYCDNNPVSRKDDGGQFWNFVIGGVVGAAVGGGSQIFSNIISGKKWSEGLGTAAMTGAASGVLAASGVGLVGSIAGNAAISMGGNAAKQVVKNRGFHNFDARDMLVDGVIGGVSGAVGGSGMGKSVKLLKLNSQLTKKVFSGSTQAVTQGAKYYLSQTKTLYKNFLLTPMIKSGLASTISLSVKGLSM